MDMKRKELLATQLHYVYGRDLDLCSWNCDDLKAVTLVIVPIIDKLQAELMRVENLLFLAATWMGTDDPDWSEVDMIKKEVEALKEANNVSE